MGSMLFESKVLVVCVVLRGVSMPAVQFQLLPCCPEEAGDELPARTGGHPAGHAEQQATLDEGLGRE